MTTIIAGQPAQIAVTVQVNGAPVSIEPTAVIQAQLFTLSGGVLSTVKACAFDAQGADWPAGVVSIPFTDVETATMPIGDIMLSLTASGATFAVKRFRVGVESSSSAAETSALFIKDFIVSEIRADQLMTVLETYMSGATVSDEYIWAKVLAAEAHVAHELRVPLVPTTFFPQTPTADQIAELAGARWGEDPGYDYKQDMMFPDKWGFIKLKNKPLIEVKSVMLDFPSMGEANSQVPDSWLRIDKKYAHVQFVPNSPAAYSGAGTFVLRALTGYSVVPMMMKITYVAGLENAKRDYPDLIDAIKKLTVLKVIEDSFPAQSGSISADGLSQSMSVDMEKYRQTVDTILNGAPGTNSGLMTAIHGIRSMVMGG